MLSRGFVFVLATLSMCAVSLVLAATSVATTGNFLVGCAVHTVSQDDPIVHPGQPGAAHRHAFAGGRPVDAFSSFGSLVAGDTSCAFKGNKSAVWSPLIIGPGGQPVAPTHHNIYYRINGRQPGTVFPFPMGLQHVRRGVAVYRCMNSNLFTSKIPTTCGTSTAGLEMSMYFPQCWNGRTLTDGSLGPCGPDFPVNVPQIQVLTRWPHAAVGGHVDPDAGGMHVDYLFGWNPFALDDVIRGCLNVDISCRVRSTGEVFDFGPSKATIIPAGRYS